MEIVREMISQPRLRSLIEAVLLEGFKDDQRYLVEKYPAHGVELSKLQTKWITWLTERFGARPTRSEPDDVTFEKALEAIRSYAPRDAAMGDKYRTNDWWRKKVDDAFPDKEWSSPADSTNMTASDMLELVKLSSMKKPRIEVDRSQGVERHEIGRAGPWKIYEAPDRESSCNIIGLKPGTDTPRADVCIARTDSSNLFYNYAADYTLFTVMRGDNPTAPEDILIFGYKDDGTPDFNANPMNNPTVDGDNDALKPSRVARILGEHHDEIMSIMGNHVLSRSGPSPARQKIESAARNISDYNDVLRGISQSEALSLKQAIAARSGISQEVQARLLTDTNKLVRQQLASNRDISQETMMQLAKDPDHVVKGFVISNPNTSREVLDFIARSDTDSMTLRQVARNRRTSPETLAAFIGHPDEGVRIRAAGNEKTPLEALKKAARRKEVEIRRAVAQNRSADEEILRYLADDPSEIVRNEVIMNRNTPRELSQQIRDGGSMANLRRLIRRMV
jgi:hypothetical protein